MISRLIILAQDELRDYRWYHADMVHPSEAAVDYIFEILQNTYMDDATIHLSNDIMKVWIMYCCSCRIRS